MRRGRGALEPQSGVVPPEFGPGPVIRRPGVARAVTLPCNHARRVASLPYPDNHPSFHRRSSALLLDCLPALADGGGSRNVTGGNAGRRFSGAEAEEERVRRDQVGQGGVDRREAGTEVASELLGRQPIDHVKRR